MPLVVYTFALIVLITLALQITGFYLFKKNLMGIIVFSFIAFFVLVLFAMVLPLC